MSRDAVLKLIAEDEILADTPWGLNVDRVFPNHAMDGSPPDGYFVILRWEGGARPYRRVRPIQGLTVSFHIKRNESSDFIPLINGLDRVIEVLTNASHEEGEDGYILTCADFTGYSSDDYDEGYDTIRKSATFDVLSRKATG